jgi:transcription elongation GreA/GreB family factor
MIKDPHEIVLSSHDAAALYGLLRARSHSRALWAEELERVLTDARVYAPEHVPPDRIRIGSTVVYLEEPAGVRRKVTLCHPDDAAGGFGRLSVISAPGLALLGRKPGSLVMSALANGWPFSVRVIEVVPMDEMEVT